MGSNMLSEYLPNNNISMLDVLKELQIRITTMVEKSKVSKEEFIKAFEDFIFIRDTFWHIKSNFIREGTLRAGIILVIKKISPLLTMITILSESVSENDVNPESIHLSLQKLSYDFSTIMEEFESKM
jgi:hypothetical protein